MTEDNRVSANLTAAQITAILTAVQDIRAEVDSFTISVSNQDRQEIPKMGAKSVGFEDKCAGTMASNPEFLPGSIDMAEVTKDRNLRAQLMQFIPQLRTLMTFGSTPPMFRTPSSMFGTPRPYVRVPPSKFRTSHRCSRDRRGTFDNTGRPWHMHLFIEFTSVA